MKVYSVNLSYGEYHVGLVAVAESKEEAKRLAIDAAREDAGEFKYVVDEIQEIDTTKKGAYVVEAGN